MTVLNHDQIPPYLTNFRCVTFPRLERDMRETGETQPVWTKCTGLQVHMLTSIRLSKLAQLAMVLTCIWGRHGLNLSWNAGHPKGFRSPPPSWQANAEDHEKGNAHFLIHPFRPNIH
jgi:hypothetical protein